MTIEKIPVSLVIPTYNRVQKLFRLLKSLNRLNPAPEEIIVIDDNSKDGTKRLLNKWQVTKKIYRKSIFFKEKNRGPADSRNIGINLSKNGLIAFTDDDVVVDKLWIKNITINIIKSSNGIVGVGGKVLSLNKDIISQYYVTHKILEAPIHMSYIPTVNCCFKKQPLIEIGGFDINFPFAGGEDTDLCLRLREKGYKFVKSKLAIVYHDFSPNFFDFCRTWLRYGKGTHQALIKSKRF